MYIKLIYLPYRFLCFNRNIMIPHASLATKILLTVALTFCWFEPELLAQDTPSSLENAVIEIFEQTCAQAGCHAAPIPQQSLDLSRDQFYAGLVDEPSVGNPDMKRVDPGNPEGSYILKKLRGDADIVGMPMPLIGDRLSSDQIATIEAWIEELGPVDTARKESAPAAKPLPFSGWKMVNLPTNRMIPANNFLFLIGHRFNPRLKDGYDAFFGLDGSGIIFLNLAYAFSDNFLVNLGRSNADDDVELHAKYRIHEQDSQGGWPISLGIQTSLNWLSEKQAGQNRLRGEVLKFTTQLMITRAITEDLGVGVVPGILFNPSTTESDEDALLTIGVGGRWRFYRNFSITAEWVPIVSGFTRTATFGNQNRFDSWGAGLEIATGGHVFQILLSNSVGLTTDQYLRGGDLDIQEGDVRLGFNIFRILN